VRQRRLRCGPEIASTSTWRRLASLPLPPARPDTEQMPPSRYEITVRGELNKALEAAFEEFESRPGNGVTVLVGELPDQAALHGVIGRIAIFGLELLDVHLAPG
jgi:hypothetical protein